MAVREIEDFIGLPAEDAPRISAKEGINIDQVLEAIVSEIPAPENRDSEPLRALIFDSYYDPYQGVICSVRIMDGTVRRGDQIFFMATKKTFEVDEVGVFTDVLKPVDELSSGEVGYITASIKNVEDTRVGDTITNAKMKASEPLPGYKEVNPMVFCGVYPADGSHYQDLKEALAKLKLNDAALSYEPETSAALGFGFRCGFLGLLHLEVTLERLDREYDLDLITTSPGVIYNVMKTDGTMIQVDNPSNLPSPVEIEYMEEPFVDASIMTPQDYIGAVMDLCQNRRGIFVTMEYIENRAVLKYELPLNEIIYDFFDTLKSRTKGYASLDYELKDYRRSNLVKLDILLNGEMVDALSFIVHADSAYARGRAVAEKLKDEIPIQACIGGKIIARETVKALRKDVISKCYGGDITRKRKLLDKQKEGKKRMRQIGKVSIPQEAFMAVLKLDE